MNRLPVPRDLYDITASWLTEALAGGATSKPVSVTSYSAEAIGAGSGFMASLFRLSLAYDQEHHDLPRTVILKLPSTDSKLRALSDKLGQYEREVRFYREKPAHGLLQVPDAYYCDIDTATGNTVLVLEDVAGGRQGDSVLGCSLPEAHHCVSRLAEFQAYWWDHPNLDTLDWMPLKDAETRLYQELYPDAWKSLIEKAGNGMPQALRSLGDRLRTEIPRIKAKLATRPFTIIHGDYRLDNCFFPTSARPETLIIFDWEFCARSRGVYDVATFITEAFPPHQRQAEEIGLLQTYHSTLLSNGVRNYPFGECLLDYRLSMLEVLVFWTITGAYCDFNGDRATTYLHNSLHRLNAAISDLSPTDLHPI